MARLSEIEKRQLVAATKHRLAKPAPQPRPMSPREYVEFATFAARFARGGKPVRFVGAEWKL
ncbi:MAG: hypothetical protein JNL39_12905 [Opitutaceae bacterium]|nr:hypothetical protein [Opitutaceae bacterium]